MKAIIFTYIVSNFLLFNIVQLDTEALHYGLNVVCGLLILTLGISHGAIDNIMYEVKGVKHTIRFIGKYIFFAILLACVWLLSPNIAFILFMISSAYHFGQSQFVEYNLAKIANKLIYLIWGLLLLAALLYFNQIELLQLAQSGFSEITIFEVFVLQSKYWFIATSIIFACLILLQYFSKRISMGELMMEFYILGLIFISFRLFGVLLGFTLYFIILHSLRVILHELAYCKASGIVKSTLSFANLLLPFTILSIAILAFSYFMLSYFKLNIALPFLAIILTSCITLPHAFVMDVFYKRTSLK